MDRSRKTVIKNTAIDDAKWDNCFVDLQSLGIKTKTEFTAYNPPKDSKDKKEYNRNWKKAKGNKK